MANFKNENGGFTGFISPPSHKTALYQHPPIGKGRKNQRNGVNTGFVGIAILHISEFLGILPLYMYFSSRLKKNVVEGDGVLLFGSPK